VNDVHELPLFGPIQPLGPLHIDRESSSCYLSIAAEAFVNTNSKHLKVMAERGLEVYCLQVGDRLVDYACRISGGRNKNKDVGRRGRWLSRGANV
jgi:hypothetical protein